MAEPNQALTQSNHGFICGDVDIAPGVAIAEGGLLVAEPGCRLVISAGVCLGSDVVIRVNRGNLVIEPGANLGSGVLVVGHGQIGHHACIGANTTVINPAIAPHQVVPPKALLGDPTQPLGHPSPESGWAGGRETSLVGAGAVPTREAGLGGAPEPVPSCVTAADAEEPSAATADSQAVATPATAGKSQVEAQPLNGTAPSSLQDDSSPAAPLTSVSHVYGKKQVSQLLATLFPHRRALNGSAPEDTA